MKKGDVQWMMTHLGDILLVLLVLMTLFIINNSMHNESLYGFDDFLVKLDEFSKGEYQYEKAHVVILDQGAAIVYFDGPKNILFEYNEVSGINFLNGDISKKIEIAVPGNCDGRCLCYLDDFNKVENNQYIILTDSYPSCKKLDYSLVYSGHYGDHNIYSFENGWLMERGLAEIASGNEDIYEISYAEDNQKGYAINNQIMSRRRAIYLSSENSETVYVYQYTTRGGIELQSEKIMHTERNFWDFERDRGADLVAQNMKQ